MRTQLYVGNIDYRMARESQLEKLFRKYGDVSYISLKQGYAFVEFEHEKDADDAIRHLDGKDLDGRPMRIEKAHGEGPRGPNRRESRSHGYEERRDRRDDHYRSRYDDRRYARDSYSRSVFSPPRETRYRLLVKNLSTRCDWQELKGLMRSVAAVTFADAHSWEKNSGYVCFVDHEGLKRAMEKYQGLEINGRCIELIDDTRSRPSPSNRSPPRKRSRSRVSSIRASSRRSSRSPSKRRRRTPDRDHETSNRDEKREEEGSNRRIKYP